MLILSVPVLYWWISTDKRAESLSESWLMNVISVRKFHSGVIFPVCYKIKAIFFKDGVFISTPKDWHQLGWTLFNPIVWYSCLNYNWVFQCHINLREMDEGLNLWFTAKILKLLRQGEDFNGAFQKEWTWFLLHHLNIPIQLYLERFFIVTRTSFFNINQEVNKKVSQF